MDEIDKAAAAYFESIPARLRAQRISKRLGARTEEQHCADCKAGACATHLKADDGALFESDDVLPTDSAEAPAAQE